MANDPDQAPAELIDFSYPLSTHRLRLEASVSAGGVHVLQGSLAPHLEGLIGGTQLSIVVHSGDPFEMEWRLPGSDRLQGARIEFGDAHINPADTPLFNRWADRPRIIGVAIDTALVDRVGEESFGQSSTGLQTRIAVRDDYLMSAAKRWREELTDGGAAGRLFAEHIGILVTAHLFRRYSDGVGRSTPPKGGLGAYRLRRVIDYIEANLSDDLTIATLAGVADRSLHHFSEAFRQSTGVQPHRYVLMRRIERAKVLLLSTDMPIIQIALEVGFSTHSHFGHAFRDATGVTPLRFRLDRL